MEYVGNSFAFGWEVALMVWLQAHLGPVGIALAKFFTFFGEEVVSVAIIAFLYWCYDKELGKSMGLNVLVGCSLNGMVKNVFDRRRPYLDHPEISCLKPVESGADIYDISAQGFSFPSGHSTTSVTLFGSMALQGKMRGWHRWIVVASAVLPFFVGASRFCLGVHYPTDVLCGWLLGAAVILVVPWLERTIKDERVFHGLLILATAPGLLYSTSDDYFSSFGLLVGFVLAVHFDKRYVNFEVTHSLPCGLLRIAVGAALFLCVNTLIELPFPESFLEADIFASFALRSLRYCIDTFVVLGIYPLAFRWMDGLFDKGAASQQ